jgi:YD repeat-containing protein
MIGQKLGLSDGSSEYSLKVVAEENVVTTFLYFNDDVIKKIETRESGNSKTVIVNEKGSITKTTYFNNLPIKIVSDSGITNYTYDDGKLITKNFNDGNSNHSFSRYYYSDNKLISIFRNLNDTLEYYVFKDENNLQLLLSKENTFKKININKTLLTSTSYEGDIQLSFNDAIVNDDGSLVITSINDDNSYNEYYDVDGLLFKENIIDSNGFLIQEKLYEYDIYNNISKTIESNYDLATNNKTNKITSIYEEGKIQEILKEEEDVIISTSVFNEYGRKIETLYKDGNKFCTITYNLDGKKIIDVQYEKR